MSRRQLSDSFSVSGQIQPGDVELLAGQGFVAIICNRPDDEEPGQPASANVAAACATHGIAFHLIPVSGGVVAAETVAAFRTALDQAGGPVLAYCRSGARSATLWQIASAPES